MFKHMKHRKEHEAEKNAEGRRRVQGVGPPSGAHPTKVDFNNTSVRASLSSPESHVATR